jgi:hypothetical protein
VDFTPKNIRNLNWQCEIVVSEYSNVKIEMSSEANVIIEHSKFYFTAAKFAAPGCKEKGLILWFKHLEKNTHGHCQWRSCHRAKG